MVQQWQYPDVVQPVLVPAAPPPVVWGWLPQAPDPVRPPPRVPPPPPELVLPPVVIHAFPAWWPQPPEPQRKPFRPYYYPALALEVLIPVRRRPLRYEVRLRGFRRRPARF